LTELLPLDFPPQQGLRQPDHKFLLQFCTNDSNKNYANWAQQEAI
jgi:hypothetical protein